MRVDTAAMNANLPQRIDAVIDYIQTHLGDALTLADIAQVACTSPFHFARLFRALTGDSVMNYVRQRRLSHAVTLLRCAPQRNVLAIAIECGFGSSEALAHAFRKQYGISPVTYRRNAKTLHPPQHKRFVMHETPSVTAIEPVFEDLPAFVAIGMAGEFAPLASMAIGQLWNEFNRRAEQIPNRIGIGAYGVCCPPGEGARDAEHFTYIAALQTSTLAEIPEGMTGVTIDAHRYAVFTHLGGLGSPLNATMRYIFGEWLPNSGMQVCGPDLEYYDEHFDPLTGSGAVRIYVPIEPRC